MIDDSARARERERTFARYEFSGGDLKKCMFRELLAQ